MGKPLEEIPSVAFRKDGGIQNNPDAPVIENLDELPWVTKVYKRDLDFKNYNVPFLLNPYISFYTSRGSLRNVLSACGPKRIPAIAGACVPPTIS
jgi:hypothetical protein